MNFGLDKITTLTRLVKELSVGLIKLNFGDNFQSFRYSGTLLANQETKIRNELNFIPNSYLISYQTGNALVTSSTTEWTKDFIYMYNQDASNSAIVKIIFWRE
jgi:hypothetical protein